MSCNVNPVAVMGCAALRLLSFAKTPILLLKEHPFRASIGAIVSDHAFLHQGSKEVLDLVLLLFVIQGVGLFVQQQRVDIGSARMAVGLEVLVIERLFRICACVFTSEFGCVDRWQSLLRVADGGFPGSC